MVRDGYVQWLQPEDALTRSQDLEPVFHDAGQFYVEKTEPFLKEFSLVTSKTVPFELSEEEVQDIDTFSDWQMAEMKYKILHSIGE